MKPTEVLVPVVLVVLGLAAVGLCGADDSPGLQGIGVLLVVAAIVLVVRAGRASRS